MRQLWMVILGGTAVAGLWVLSGCDSNPSHYSYRSELAVDTASVADSVLIGTSVMLVYSVPAGCSRLPEATVEIHGDTIYTKVTIEFYFEGEPCAHGPIIDSLSISLDVPSPGVYLLVYEDSLSSQVAIPITILTTFPAPDSVHWRAAAESFFPLEPGNLWVYAMVVEGIEIRRDTIRISESMILEEQTWYHLKTPWQATGHSFWGHLDSAGDLQWRSEVEGTARPLFLFDAAIDTKWLFRPDDCIDSLRMRDRGGSVTVPYGEFSDVREFVGITTSCMDFNWSISFARGVGPVQWFSHGMPPVWEWVLLEAQIADSCCGVSGN